jgi:dienelactone hydrolase
MMSRIGYPRCVAACLLLAATALALPQARGLESTPSPSLLLIPSSDQRVPMRTMVYRPAGKGPFPLAIISHGSSSDAEQRAHQDLAHFEDLAFWFVRRGYVVAIPQRPGHGKTGGEWLEAYDCETPQYEQSGLTIAGSITATIRYLTKQPFVQKDGVVLIGHSAGGWGSLALASQNPRAVAAVINFAGGLGGRADSPNKNCAPERLVNTAAKFGITTRIPTIWIYAKNDSYFGPDLSSAMAEAFRKAGGGPTEYHLLPSMGDDGHFLIYQKRAVAIWGSLIDAFLRRYNSPRY